MKKTSYLLFVFALLTCAFTSIAAAEAIPVGISESIAIVTDYKGGCNVRPLYASEWKSVSFGMPVYEGDEFKTSEGSFIEITFDDATLVRLDENAALKLSALKRDKQTGVAKTIFNLTIGKMLAVVDKLLNPESSFEVHTKMAIAAVKGTDLGVSSSETGDTLGVFEGSVFYTGADGSNGVQVEGGNESTTGADGRPGVPEALREMLKDKEKMNKMRETIRNIMGMKKTGTLALFLEAKKEDSGKEDKPEEVNTPVSGNALKNRLRRELRETRTRAFEEMGYVTEQTKIDNYLGKSVIDVHGNRVRFEDYILRPQQDIGGGQMVNKEVDYLNLTFRENSLNMLKTAYYFASPLNEIIPDNYWYTFWDGTNYPLGPDNYVSSKATIISNGNDKIETNTEFQVNQAMDWGFYTQPQADDRILVKNTESMSINGVIKEYRYINSMVSMDPNYTYVMLKDMTLDQTFIDPAMIGRTGETGYYEEPLHPMMPNDRSVIKHYNDGTTIKLEYFTIYDNGVKAVAPQRPEDFINMVKNTNIEVQISSNVFTHGGIDLVSKYMWLHMLNPPGMMNPGGTSGRYWDLLDPRMNEEFNVTYSNSAP